MRSHLTVRGLPADLARALEQEKRRRGATLNSTVIDLLRRAVGLSPEAYDNGLGRLAGTWSDNELTRFEQATKCFEQVDAELWS